MSVKEEAANVKDELEHNAFLISIRPGGILHDYVEKGPAEVLCVPRESFLKSSGLEPYLLLPPLSSSSLSPSSGVCLIVDGSMRLLTPEQHAEVARILREHFLYYHTLHFKGVASAAFTTLRGQQGEFASNLQSVSRYGRIGSSAVICDSAPLMDRDDPDLPDFHPCKMHIFFIQEPLMDKQEMQNTLTALKRAILPPTPTPQQKQQPKQQQQQRTTLSSDVTVSGNSSLTSDRFSRENITKYRRSVAADYDVHYGEFQEYMEMPICVPLAKTLSNFVETIQQREIPPLTNADVKRAIKVCMDHCNRIPMLARDEGKQRIALEGFERYIMTKLYWRAFDVDSEDQQQNARLTAKLRQLSPILQATQLDALPAVEKSNTWNEAIFELEGMNYFKSPHEKLRCVVRASRLLSTAIHTALSAEGKKPHGSEKESNSRRNSGSRKDNHPHTSSNNHNSGDAVAFGADEFLPCFMLLVLRASPRNYYLNLQYVKRFRNETLMTHEESYCLANMESAAEFWLTYNETPQHERRETKQKQEKQHQEKQEKEKQNPPSIDDLFPASPDGSPIVAQEVNMGSSSQLGFVLDDKMENHAGEDTGSDTKVFGQFTNKEVINVAHLLLEEQKSFEELTVLELRAIVAEARILLAEKQDRRERSHREEPQSE
ncbi:putative MCAK-like kinesin [Trypanosoma theileri]|uniref:Putative MCAK-like kinesin n=1 Tax=Trypanosoma theileri TaxID=67003 RepID=A0A1X0P117_9TRYP|nr:putative MCAK-like kinesin [Trypanosoma theileri]ORC90403.1 putative MCAK-like kinesin [Trypanosoma theileri]